MRLSTNTIASNNIREATENGVTYLVAEDITLGKPMLLDGGYVPEEEWRKSANAWDGRPGPVGHPTDADGNLISANIDAVQTHSVIAEVRDTYYSDADDGLNGDIWVNVDKADQLGGLASEVPDILRNGDPLEVSTAYYSDPGEPGEYDGKLRENVRKNLRPDHVALLPGDLGPGRCSRASGCGVPATDGVSAGDAGASPSATAGGDADSAIATNGVMVANGTGDAAGLVVAQMAGGGDSPDGSLSAAMSIDDESGGDESTDTENMNANQSEGDRVRWRSSNGNWRYGLVADEAESSQEVDDDEVLIAVYVNGEDGWTRGDETTTVKEDNLEVIDEFPSEAKSNNTSANAGGDDGEVAFNPEDLPNAPDYDNSASFWKGMFNAVADFARGEQEANATAAGVEDGSEERHDNADDDHDHDHDDDHDHDHDDHSANGGDCGCGGECGECGGGADAEPDADADDAEPSTTMSNFNDDDYERLASVSAWSADELRANDAVATKVAQTIDEQDLGEVEADGEDDDEPADDPNPADEDDDGDLPDNPGEDADEGEEEMPAWARELQNDVQELKANHEQQKQAQRSEKKEQILANSEAYTESMLDSMDDEDFEDAFERSVPAGNSAPAGTDFGGLSTPSAHHNTEPAANSDGEENVGPATSGSFDDFLNEEAN